MTVLSLLGYGAIDTRKISEICSDYPAKGAPIGTVWGFIDGTIHDIARPTYHKHTCYKGWKWKHSLKYYKIVTPNGLISYLFGSVDGRRNDAVL